VSEKQGKSNPTQRAKFAASASELGCDESEERFDAALKRVASAKDAAANKKDAAKIVKKKSSK
jgi:hypothetical protein